MKAPAVQTGGEHGHGWEGWDCADQGREPGGLGGAVHDLLGQVVQNTKWDRDDLMHAFTIVLDKTETDKLPDIYLQFGVWPRHERTMKWPDLTGPTSCTKCKLKM